MFLYPDEDSLICSLRTHQKKYSKLMIDRKNQHTFVGATPE